MEKNFIYQRTTQNNENDQFPHSRPPLVFVKFLQHRIRNFSWFCEVWVVGGDSGGWRG